jgi:hypothetical protein
MKRKTILAIVVMAIMLAPLWAQSEDDFEVTQNRDNTLTITNYKGSVKDIVIPGTLYGLRVTTIGENAFREKGLTSVVIPNTVVTIGHYAFYSDFWSRAGNNFTEVIIPNSVTTIGQNAFSECGITRLSLGTGVQTIGYMAFYRNKITTLTLPASLRTIGELTFSDNQIKSLTIPNTVTLVGFRSFMDNPIETLVIPASLAARRTNTTGLYPEAFNAFNTLTRVTLPANMDDSHLSYSTYSDGSGGQASGLLDIGLINFYKGQNKSAGTYVKRGPIWTRE